MEKLPSSVDKKLRRRCVWWFVETYVPSCDFEYALNKASHWAYIYHDRDKCEPHYHVLLHYDNARTGYAVLKDFAHIQNSMAESTDSPVSCYEYLTHANDVDKFQYPSSDIVCHNPIYWEHFLPSVRDRTQVDFIDDLLNDDDIDLSYMARKYGRDFIKNYKAYLDFRREVLFRERYL